MVIAGSPDPEAKSSTTLSGVIAAAESREFVIAVFQRALASAHRSLTRARAAASHNSRAVISLLHSIRGIFELNRQAASHPPARLANDLPRREHLLYLLYPASTCVFHLGSRIPDDDFFFVSE